MFNHITVLGQSSSCKEPFENHVPAQSHTRKEFVFRRAPLIYHGLTEKGAVVAHIGKSQDCGRGTVHRNWRDLGFIDT